MEKMIRVLFLLLTVSVAEVTSAYPYAVCGDVACAADPMVSCDASGTACVCPPGEVGDGRVQCANPDEHCLCTFHGDPHIITFDNENFALPLPCAHELANLQTPVSAGDCKVLINGRSWYRNPLNSVAAFEHFVEVRVEFGNIILLVKFHGTTRPVKTLQFRNGYIITGPIASFPVDLTVQPDEFYRLIVPPCKLILKYRGKDSSFALLTPVGVEDNSGLCGECEEMEPKKISRRNAFRKAINSLSKLSPYDDSNMNNYPECNTLTDAVNNCAPGRKTFAIDYCQVTLVDKVARDCLINHLGSAEKELEKIAECFELICNAPVACTAIDIFEGCVDPGYINSFKSVPGFCQP